MVLNWSVAVAALTKDQLEEEVDCCKSVMESDTCGEDSFCIHETDKYCVISVADGVGGWKRHGIDPSAFSRTLMDQVGSCSPNLRGPDGSPSMQVLKAAFQKLIESYVRGDTEPFGSSTICVSVLDRASGVLDVANLGDSAALLVRGDTMAMLTERQQSKFNAPLQLTLDPSGKPKGNPARASHQQVKVQPGDILIMATDGLWDNLYMEDIDRELRAARRGADERVDEEWLAIRLADDARRVACNPVCATPFSEESKEAGLVRPGGKADDITVIVGRCFDTSYDRIH